MCYQGKFDTRCKLIMPLKIEFLLMHDGWFFGRGVSFADSFSPLNPSEKYFKTSKNEIWKKLKLRQNLKILQNPTNS